MTSFPIDRWRFTSQGPVSDFDPTLDAQDEPPNSQYAADEPSRHQRQPLIHLLDLLHPLRAADERLGRNIPPIFKESDAVDAATPVGRGASFLVTRVTLPESPAHFDGIASVRKGATGQSSRLAPPRPGVIAYKTANLRFLDDGTVHPDDRLAAKSVLTEFDSLTYGPHLRSPNIVDYLGFCWATNPYDSRKKLPALLVEYADLGSLAAFQGTSILSGAEKKMICLDVARGLDAIHKAGMVHGDVKSENVLVFSHPNRHFVAKIGDFGFSQYVGQEDAMIRLGGTRPWTAPEVQGPVHTSLLTKTDIYSFGLLALVVAVDGANPFEMLLPKQSANAQSRTGRAQQIESYKKSAEFRAALKASTWLTAYCMILCRSGESTFAKTKLRALLMDKAALLPAGQGQQDLMLFVQIIREGIASGNFDIGLQLEGFSRQVSEALLSFPGKNLYPCLDGIWESSVCLQPEHRDLTTILKILSDGQDEEASLEAPQTSESTGQSKSRPQAIGTAHLTATPTKASLTTINVRRQKSGSNHTEIGDKSFIQATNTSDETTRHIVAQVNPSRPVAIQGYSVDDAFDMSHRSQRGDRNISWQHMRTLAPSVQSFLIDHYPKVRTQERFSLGGLHINGYGTPKDAEEGCRLVRSSAQSGNLRAKAFAYRLHRACNVPLPADFPWEDYLFELAQMRSGPALADLRAVNKPRSKNLLYHALHISSHFVNGSMLDGRTIATYNNEGAIIDIAKGCENAKAYMVNTSGHGLIHLAASLGDHSAVKMLVEHFAIDVNQQSRNGDTALLCALRCGSGKVAAMLLQHFHADASIASQTGESPLHWLIEFEDQWIEPMGKDLLAHGGNVNAMTNVRIQYSRINSGIDIDFKMPGTPLAFAIHENRPKMVQWLLQNGADAGLHSTLSLQPPLNWAAYFHRHECLHIMIKGLERRHAHSASWAKSDARHAVFYSPLVTYAFESADRFSMIMRNGTKYLECLHKTLDLLREKTRLISMNLGMSTALLEAVKNAHDEVVDYLLESKWEVSGLEPEYGPDGQLRAEGLNIAGGAEKMTPILQAVRSNRRPMFDKLLEHGAEARALALNPFDASQQNYSALHIFAYEGHTKDVDLIPTLVTLGVPVDGVPIDPASPEPKVYQTETPLGISLRRTALAQATTLLAHGAHIDALAYTSALTASAHALTPLGLAIAANQRSSAPRIAAMLARLPVQPAFTVEPARSLTALHRCALAHADLSDVVTGAPKSAAAWDFETARAVMLELVHVFGGRDCLDARSGIGGASALHLAVAAGNVGAVEVLVGAGASVCVADDAGRSVVECARAAVGDVALEIRAVVERAWRAEGAGATSGVGDSGAPSVREAGGSASELAAEMGAGGYAALFAVGDSMKESSSLGGGWTPETSGGEPAHGSALTDEALANTPSISQTNPPELDRMGELALRKD